MMVCARRRLLTLPALAIAIVVASSFALIASVALPRVVHASGSNTYYTTDVKPSSAAEWFALAETTQNPQWGYNGCGSPGDYGDVQFADKVSATGPWGQSCQPIQTTPSPFPGDSEAPLATLQTSGGATPAELMYRVLSYSTCASQQNVANCGLSGGYQPPEHENSGDGSFLVNFWEWVGSSGFCASGSWAGLPNCNGGSSYGRFVIWSNQTRVGQTVAVTSSPSGRMTASIMFVSAIRT